MARTSIQRELLSLTLPMVGMNFLMVAMHAVHAAMCARLADPEVALAAIGYVMQAISLLTMLMLGLTTGTAALIARAHGAADGDRLDRVIFQAIRLTVGLGIASALAGIAVAVPVLRAFGASPEIAQAGAGAMQLFLAGIPLSFLSLLLGVVLRAMGNTRAPFVCVLAATATNIVASYAFMFGRLGMPALGIEGAAVGALLSHGVHVVALVIAMRSVRRSALRWSGIIRSGDRSIAREVVRIGGAAALDLLLVNIGLVAMLVILGRIDHTAVAGHVVGIRVQSLAFGPGLVLSHATAVLVGQALGAGSVARAREVARISAVVCAAIMVPLGAACMAGAGPIMTAFGVPGDTGLGALTRQCLLIFGATMLPLSFQLALTGVLRGAGDTASTFRISVVATAVQLALAVGLGFGPAGAVGVWLSLPGAALIRVALSYRVYRRGAWAVTGVSVQEQRL